MEDKSTSDATDSSTSAMEFGQAIAKLERNRLKDLGMTISKPLSEMSAAEASAFFKEFHTKVSEQMRKREADAEAS